MNCIQRHSVLYGTLILLLSLSAPLYAAENSCSFLSMVTADDFSYRVASNPLESCDKQLVSISVLKNASPFTQFVNHSDFLIENAWAEDVDDDGRFELLVVSHKLNAETVKTLDIFSVDGNQLKQVRIPELPDKNGYRGGDQFYREGGKIVRSYPVYLPNDIIGKPTGGENRVLYHYRNRELLLAVAAPAAKAKQFTGKTESSRGNEPVKILSVQPKQNYIEVGTNFSTDRYKVLRLKDPARLVLDFQGAVTDLQNKTINIGRFGIVCARIGQNKGFVRIVFDAADSLLPTETITPAENALRIGFYPSK